MNGVNVEVGAVEKPNAARDCVKTIRAYIRTMSAQQKRPQRVVVTRQQYTMLHKVAMTKRDDHLPPVTGLLVDGVPLHTESES